MAVRVASIIERYGAPVAKSSVTYIAGALLLIAAAVVVFALLSGGSSAPPNGFVVVRSETVDVDHPDFRAHVLRLHSDIASLGPAVVELGSHYYGTGAPSTVSVDGHSTVLPFAILSSATEVAASAAAENLERVVEIVKVADGHPDFKVRIASAAPEFELEALEGGRYARGDQVSLSDFEGQPVVINFWYPSCGPCRLEMPHLQESSERRKADGIQFIGVQSLTFLDTPEDGQEFIDEIGVTYPVLIDPDGSVFFDYKANRLNTPPYTVFLGKSHEVLRTWDGTLTVDKMDELFQEHGLLP